MANEKDFGKDSKEGDFDISKNNNSYLIKIDDNSFDFERPDWDSRILGINFYRINDMKLKNNIVIK